eukprot:145907_1
MSSRQRQKRRSRSKSGSKKQQNNNKQPRAKKPAFITECRSLLQQLTQIPDSKSFYKLLPTNHTLYRDYKHINSSPISFKKIQERLNSTPCHYKSYSDFDEDVKKIFYQEQRLKTIYKGDKKKLVSKRFTASNRTKDFWKTLTAPHNEYGFDAIINNKNKNK